MRGYGFESFIGEPRSLVIPHLPAKITSSTAASGRRYADSVRKFKAAPVERALLESNGHRTRAAELLGVYRSNLAQMVEELEVGTDADRAAGPVQRDLWLSSHGRQGACST